MVSCATATFRLIPFDSFGGPAPGSIQNTAQSESWKPVVEFQWSKLPAKLGVTAI